MSKEQSYQKAAQEILRLVGGKENIVSAAHCATRLRLVLQDEKKADVDGILKTELVKGQFANAGQFQIIIGSGTVDEVYKYFVQYAEISESTKSEVKQAADQKMNSVQKLVKMLSDMFVPIIPALVASGLLMGLNNILTASGLFVPGQSLVEAYPAMADVASMINTFASAAYSFLPILIGFSAARMFGANPYLGAVVGMIMVSGDLLNAYSYGTAVSEGTIPVWNIFGLQIEKVGYQGTVLPVLAAVAILAFIEKRLHRVIPEALDNLLTPALSVLITSFLTFTIVGGVMRTAGDWITNGLLWLHDSLGVIGGMVFGFIYAPLTMTGMHHSLLPVDIQLIASGASFLLAIAACNNVAQGGATLAAMVCTKDKKLKGVAASSGISALLGITEPAMFGVNLKLKYPFYAAMIGSAVGCGYVTLTNVQNISPGAAGIIGFICIRSDGILNFLIGTLLSLAVGFAVTVAFSRMKKFNPELNG
ncbi:MAG: sucrose-specific PTS transporter subunit IIBC [Eubacteriales bacterium]|nr:sucrose-specific PTS transporter subunit IIBC [Eubacteriales bacterium]